MDRKSHRLLLKNSVNSDMKLINPEKKNNIQREEIKKNKEEYDEHNQKLNIILNECKFQFINKNFTTLILTIENISDYNKILIDKKEINFDINSSTCNSSLKLTKKKRPRQSTEYVYVHSLKTADKEKPNVQIMNNKDVIINKSVLKGNENVFVSTDNNTILIDKKFYINELKGRISSGNNPIASENDISLYTSNYIRQSYRNSSSISKKFDNFNNKSEIKKKSKDQPKNKTKTNVKTQNQDAEKKNLDKMIYEIGSLSLLSGKNHINSNKVQSANLYELTTISVIDLNSDYEIKDNNDKINNCDERSNAVTDSSNTGHIFGNNKLNTLTRYLDNGIQVDTSNSFSKENKENQDFILTYQFKVIQGRQSSIQIYYDDIKTLEPAGYLNDKIIMFYLKFLQSELSAEILKGKFVILDTYFYHKLSMNESAEMYNPLINYNSVKKWTKNISFFKNDFILIPINEDEHWSLLIICYPNRISNFFSIDTDTIIDQSVRSDCPIIIYLDSFYEDNPRCRNIFKKYLYYEYADKNSLPYSEEELLSTILNTGSLITEFIPKVPKQPNTFDCGIYLLAYAELFLFDPNYLLHTLNEGHLDVSNWFSLNFIRNKRHGIKDIICEMANKSEDERNKIVDKYIVNREEIMKISYNFSYVLEKEVSQICSSDSYSSSISNSHFNSNNFKKISDCEL